MKDDAKPKGVIPAKELEAAFDALVAKLIDFGETLEEDERAALLELVDAAAAHTDYVQARDEGDIKKILYMKPVQVHATQVMKQRMKDLPARFYGKERGPAAE